MTTDLEKRFFDTFGIKPKHYCCYHDCNCPINDVGKFNSKCPKQAVTKECDARIMQKPRITDRILLELISICVLYGWHLCRYWNGSQDFVYENQKLKPEERFCVIDTDLKNATLILLIELVNKEGVKHQVQALFEEDR